MAASAFLRKGAPLRACRSHSSPSSSGASVAVVVKARAARPRIFSSGTGLPSPSSSPREAISGLHLRPKRAVAMASGGDGGASELGEKIQSLNADHGVVIYSKSWCPFCAQAKQIFDDLGVAYFALELDEIEEGADVQAALQGITGIRTVPQVFVKGELVGGCDGEWQWQWQWRCHSLQPAPAAPFDSLPSSRLSGTDRWWPHSLLPSPSLSLSFFRFTCRHKGQARFGRTAEACVQALSEKEFSCLLCSAIHQ